MVKLLVVTGGSLSGIGKGTCASAIGVVLKAQGLRVTSIKIDPYLNVDAGTISPQEHGEVYVLGDGHEGDLDLGNYERALDIRLTRDHNITTGKVFQRIIQSERNGDFLGATVQLVPHVTDSIQDWITEVAKVPVDASGLEPDVCLVEVGGTVGDIESMVYLQAFQQLFAKLDSEDYALCHLTYIPQVGAEQKTKCAQHSFKALMESGLFCDVVFARARDALEYNTKRKLGLFSGVRSECVIGLPDTECLYTVPNDLAKQDLDAILMKRLHLNSRPRNITNGKTTLDIWNGIAEHLLKAPELLPQLRIGVVAKYTGANDTYLSVLKALEHASFHVGVRVDVVWLKAGDDQMSEEQDSLMRTCHGILVPGGFGSRGFSGKLQAVRYARENKIPFLGICLGMQAALVEGVKNLLGRVEADSEEFNPDSNEKVIVFMPETGTLKVLGGTMRLGDRQTYIHPDEASLAYRLYNRQATVVERHRHRYEFNIDYMQSLEACGYRFVGKDSTGKRLEIVELKDHPFFLGVQYHPELNSRPAQPNPCFLGLVKAASGRPATE